MAKNTGPANSKDTVKGFLYYLEKYDSFTTVQD